MNNLVIKSVLTFLLMFLFLPVSANNSGSDLVVIKEKTFPTSQGKTVFVKISGGDIKVNSWDKNEVYVKILGNENAEEKLEFELNNTESGVEIISRKKDSGINWFQNIKLRVEIIVPGKYNSDLNTSGGDIYYAGIIGTAKMNTSGGDIDGKNFEGKLDISTSGGDIALYGRDAEIDAHTSGGDIFLDYEGKNAGIDLSTSGGDITIKLPGDLSASLELSTSGGEISCSYKMSNVIKMSKSKLVAELNGGGVKLSAHTSGGDVEVLSK